MANRRRNAYISSPAKTRLPQKRRKSQFWQKFKNAVQKNKTAFLSITIIVLVIIIIRLIYGFTIGKPENTIQEVTFTDESVQMYDYKNVYAFIRDQLSGNNVVMLNINGANTEKDIIRDTYPFIKDISIEKSGVQTASVSVDYHTAELVFQNEYVSIAYANKFLFPVNNNNAISSGALFVELPPYFSGENVQLNATGYLSLIGPEKIKNDFMSIQERIPLEDILFLVGSQKSIIISGNKRIIFDHKRDIKTQVEYLIMIQGLEEAMYYDIDLTTFPKVIIRKQEGAF